jgi:hypothetical protein
MSEREALEAEIMRQYEANPQWDEAKDVIEGLDCEAILAALTVSQTKCSNCGGRGYVAGDPEGAPIEDCCICRGSGRATPSGWRTSVDDIVQRIVRDVAELPDRTSPEGQEHMMLVAGDELEDIIRRALPASPASPAEPEQPAGDAGLPEPRRGDTHNPVSSVHAAALEEAAEVIDELAARTYGKNTVEFEKMIAAAMAIRALGEK